MYFNLAASKLQYQQQFQVLPTVASKDMAYMPPIPEQESLLEEERQEGDVELQATQTANTNISMTTTSTTTNNTNKTKNDHFQTSSSLMDPTDTGSFSGELSVNGDALEPGATVEYKVPVHDYWVMGLLLGWTIVLAIIGFGQSLSLDTKQVIVGLITNFNLLFFYGAPLSTIAVIFKTRNTASIHVPTMTMNTINSCFWTAYGFAIMDFFVLVPNGIGACLGFLQVFLYMTFPRQSDTTPNTIAATVVVGDTVADAVVMGDPTSEDAVIMLNRDDVHRLQHSIAIDQKLGGVQIVTSAGVPAFPSHMVEPALIDRRVRQHGLNHRRCVTFDAGSLLPTAAAATAFVEASQPQDMEELANTTTATDGMAAAVATPIHRPLPPPPHRNRQSHHTRHASISGVPLINLSKHRRQASTSNNNGTPSGRDHPTNSSISKVSALQQSEYDTFVMNIHTGGNTHAHGADQSGNNDHHRDNAFHV